MSSTSSLPGGSATRLRPTGLRGGRRVHAVADPLDALGLVAHDLQLAEGLLRDVVGSDVAAVPHIAGYLLDGGGKRLRPALTALGARAIGVEEPLPLLMVCGELIHLGSLLHDDVVDQGDTRRGRAAAHVVWGNAVSVLTGDFCVARALLAASEAGGLAAVQALARTVAQMSEGEVVQLQRAGDLDNDRATYLDVIDRKSASLIAWCTSAAALRQGDLDAAEALATYGRKVGTAFQVTDDVLDYRPGTGKTPGADLRERKVTLPLLHAMERLPDLREQLAEGTPTPDEVAELVVRIEASGALDAALDEAHGFVDEAMDALADLPETDGREALAVLGRYLVERTS